jgi:hypothetical protein
MQVTGVVYFLIKNAKTGWAQLCEPVVPAFWKLSQENLEFEAILSSVQKHCLKEKKKRKRKK